MLPNIILSRSCTGTMIYRDQSLISLGELEVMGPMLLNKMLNAGTRKPMRSRGGERNLRADDSG